MSASPLLPAASTQHGATTEIEAEPAEVLESVDDEGRKHDIDLRDETLHDIQPDFDELSKMHVLISEPVMVESSEFEPIEHSYEIRESSNIQEDDIAAIDKPLVDTDVNRSGEHEKMSVSIENIEQVIEEAPSVEIEEVIDEAQEEADVATQLEELHRLKSSSYEDIYNGTNFVPEKTRSTS